MRMFRMVVCILLIAALTGLVGCAAHVHKVGAGAAGADVAKQRQWYILWGLVPLNSVDSNAMAGGASDYEIKTEQSFVDVVLNIFTGFVTINSRTVKVTK